MITEGSDDEDSVLAEVDSLSGFEEFFRCVQLEIEFSRR